MYYTKDTYRDVEFFNIEPDTYGNPRVVVWYGDIPFREQNEDEPFRDYQLEHFAHSVKALGGKRYRGKWFGGGIILQAYGVKGAIDKALA